MNWDDVFGYAVVFGILFGAPVAAAGRWVVKELRTHRQELWAMKERQRREAIEGPQPICGCGHHYAYHAQDTGECSQSVEQTVKKDTEGHVLQWRLIPCPCRVYSGLPPVNLFHPPGLTAPTVSDSLDRQLAQAEIEASDKGRTNES